MVELRPVEASDSERLLMWRNQPSVADHMYTDHVISQEEHDAWFAAATADPSKRYWIINVDDEPVGLANLTDLNLEARRCAWAFYLGEDRRRGAGVGAKVEHRMLSIVFDELELNKLTCEVLVANEAVIKLHEKFGFRREAYHRQHVWRGGRPLDVVGLALLRSEWNVLRPGIEARVLGRSSR